MQDGHEGCYLRVYLSQMSHQKHERCAQGSEGLQSDMTPQECASYQTKRDKEHGLVPIAQRDMTGYIPSGSQQEHEGQRQGSMQDTRYRGSPSQTETLGDCQQEGQ